MRKNQVAILFITVFIDLVGFGMIIPLNPYLARQFGADPTQVGLLMAIYSLMQFIFAPVWGRLSDALGRRPVLVLSLFGAGTCHFLFAMAPNYESLFIARMLAGVMSANISIAMAAMADLTDEKNRASGMGLMGAAFGLGFMFGPFLGGLASSWGSAFGSVPPFGPSFAAVMAAVICIGNSIFAYLAFAETRSSFQDLRENERLTKNLVERMRLTGRFLGKPVVGILLFSTFVFVTAMGLMEAPLFMLVQDRLQWSIESASMGFAYVGLVLVFTQGFFIRKLYPILGEARVLLLGCLLAAIGFIGIAYSSEVLPLAIAVTLLGLGAGCVTPSINGTISLFAHESEQGLAMGVNQSLSAMGRVIGPALGGLLYQKWGGGSPFLLAGILSAAIFIWIFLLRTRLPKVR